MTQTLSVSLASGLLYVSGTVNGAATTWTHTSGDTWETVCDRAEDDIYRVELEMVESSGITSKAAFTLYYGILQLITDRTQADVEEVRRIRNKIHAVGEEKADEYGFEYIEYPPLNEILTPEEYSAYFAGMRGAYNASDMNRVGNAVQYIADRLTAERYGVYVSPRIGWTEDDFVRQADWNAYLDDVRHLRGILTLLPTTPEITDAMYDGIGFIEANHIEQILMDLDFMITRIILNYVYAGEVFSGEV